MVFLDRIVYGEGTKVDTQQIEIVLNCPRPTSLTDIRSFVGLQAIIKGS